MDFLAPWGPFSAGQRKGSPAKPVGLLGKGGARKRAEGARRKPEAKRTLRRRPPGAILSARTESMEKDAPKGGPFGIPPNLGCVLLWFSTPGNCPSVAVKKPPVFCGSLFVQRFPGPISRRLPKGRSQAPQIGTKGAWRKFEAAGNRVNRTARAKDFFGALYRTVQKQGRRDSQGLALGPVFRPFLAAQKWTRRRPSPATQQKVWPSETRPPLRSGKYGPRRRPRWAAERVYMASTQPQISRENRSLAAAAASRTSCSERVAPSTTPAAALDTREKPRTSIPQ